MRKHLITALASVLLLAAAFSAVAQTQPANDVTRFPGAVYVYKYMSASQVYGRDSVTGPLASFTLLRGPKAVADSGRFKAVKADTINGYVQTTYAILDSALTGYATTPSDTLRLVCGANVSGYFVAGITGTSNGAAFTIGHLPAACRPSHAVVVGLSQVTNNAVTRFGTASIATTGIMTLSKTDSLGVQSATFTSTGTKAVGAGVTFAFPRF